MVHSTVSRVDFLVNMLRNLYINITESYVSFKYHKRNLLWHEKIIILHLFRILLCFFKFAFTWLSQIWRHAYYYCRHSFCHICVWLSWYYNRRLCVLHLLSYSWPFDNFTTSNATSITKEEFSYYVLRSTSRRYFYVQNFVFY